MRKHKISFINAANGIIWALKTQPNFRIHLFLATLAIFLGFILKISYIEMTILILVIILCLTAEMINTSIEAMTDLIEERWHYKAKIAKDVAAGMMLISAIGAVIVAGLLFLPYLCSVFI